MQYKQINEAPYITNENSHTKAGGRSKTVFLLYTLMLKNCTQILYT